jgi:hypothetical protein
VIFEPTISGSPDLVVGWLERIERREVALVGVAAIPAESDVDHRLRERCRNVLLAKWTACQPCGLRCKCHAQEWRVDRTHNGGIDDARSSAVAQQIGLRIAKDP